MKSNTIRLNRRNYSRLCIIFILCYETLKSIEIEWKIHCKNNSHVKMDKTKTIDLSHHKKQEYCTSRLKYRDGKKLTAVKAFI